MKHKSLDSYNDTVKAIFYLAEKEDMTESCEELSRLFPNCSQNALHTGNIGKLLPGSRIRLNLNGVSIVDMLKTNQNARRFNKAAFIISIISLCVGIVSSVFAVIAIFL